LKRPLGRLRHKHRKIILKCTLKKQGAKMWTGFIWLRIKISGGLI
jgi:hypothetical protein